MNSGREVKGEPPSPATMDGPGAANNSSDFVRKLYKMLEDPSYSSVVRWGDDGDSFVVLENEKFTKSILPKHFKHSNFASFVRQLNKYDFHKVRQNNDESGTGPTSAYGPNAWEFKHPEFRANSKDSLDNIRRKAPAPRKPANLSEEQIPIQQIDLMNQQIVAQAQQIESLAQSNNQLQMNHQMVVQELLRLQKTVVSHDRIIHDVMTFLHSVDAKQRRDSKALFAPPPDNSSTTLTPNSQTMPTADADEPASPLQHASKILSDINTEVAFNISGLEQMNGSVPTPPVSGHPHSAPYQGHSRGQPTSATSSGSMNPAELENIVYPMGTTNGIDPMYGDHIHNIPYGMPTKQEHGDPRAQFADSRKRSQYTDPGWARQPRILLVEDDLTCRQIGGKFLYSFNCIVDNALDGLEAVSKMQDPSNGNGPGASKYDMILMDIIMPNLDGVSACHIIRQFDRTPIVAMTSNIRSDDIQMYFQHGMDDVLPKPFTRKSLLEMLEKHLSYLKKDQQNTNMPAPPGGGVSQSSVPSVRDDLSAAASPAGSSGTWNSPSQYSNVSPDHPQMQYAAQPYMDAHQAAYASHAGNVPVTPGGMRAVSGGPPSGAHRRGPSEISGGGGGDMSASKRQRMAYSEAHMAAPMRQ